MKEDRAAQKPLARAAYNVQIGTENQFIVGYSVHQQADDSTCFISHMEQQTFPHGLKPNNGSGDAGYGSEENYAWLEKNDIQNFFRYHTFHKEQHPPRKPEFIAQARFQSANFPYDPVKDEFTCPVQAKVHPG
jgi:hypothetical protein